LRFATSGHPLTRQTYDWVRSLFGECSAQHRSCCEKETARLPKRILELKKSGAEDPVVRLVEPDDIRATYVALSHCWGNERACITSTANIEERKVGIPWQGLSKTFRDAIVFAMKLDFHYLWIDSLCIIQDDPADWDIESSKMSDIYQNASLTLAATVSSSDSEGCYPDEILPSHIVIRPEARDSDRPAIAIRKALHHWNQMPASQVALKFPLLSRAWVFQERLLSRRILHFCDSELIWECRQLSECECGSFIETTSPCGQYFNVVMASENAGREAAKQEALDKQGELDLLFAPQLMEMEEASQEEAVEEILVHQEILEEQEEHMLGEEQMTEREISQKEMPEGDVSQEEDLQEDSPKKGELKDEAPDGEAEAAEEYSSPENRLKFDGLEETLEEKVLEGEAPRAEFSEGEACHIKEGQDEKKESEEVQEDKLEQGKLAERATGLDDDLDATRLQEDQESEETKAIEGVGIDTIQSINDDTQKTDSNHEPKAEEMDKTSGESEALDEVDSGENSKDDTIDEVDGRTEAKKDSGNNADSEESQAKDSGPSDEDPGLRQKELCALTEEQTEAQSSNPMTAVPVLTQAQIEAWLTRGEHSFDEQMTHIECNADAIEGIDHTKAGIDDVGHFHRLLEQYTRLHLTKPSDRLPALSGLCRRVQDLRGQYCAGLWYDSIAYDLMWRVESLNPDIENAGRPPKYRGPSWSWVSVDSPVTYWPDIRDLYHRPPGFRVKAKVTMAGQNPFGEIISASLNVKSFYATAVLESTHSPRRHSNLNALDPSLYGLKVDLYQPYMRHAPGSVESIVLDSAFFPDHVYAIDGPHKVNAGQEVKVLLLNTKIALVLREKFKTDAVGPDSGVWERIGIARLSDTMVHTYKIDWMSNARLGTFHIV
jgi:hypothetical protein